MNDYNKHEGMEAEKIDLIRLFDDILKGAKLFWPLSVAAIVILTLFFYLSAYRNYAPVYTSEATFVVTRDETGLNNNNYVNEQTAGQIVKTFPYILNSGLLQKKVSAELGMDTVPGRIRTEILGRTNMITILVTSGKEEHAQQILEAVIKHYPDVAEPVIGEVQMNLLDITEKAENTAQKPSFKRSIVRGVTGAAGLFILLLIAYAATRDTIHEIDDTKKKLNLNCISAIPQITFKKRGKAVINNVSIYNKKITQTFLESVRTLRARIEKYAVANGINVFLVTSTAPGEGKSTVAGNVAMALAMSGAKVTLVDCDLRKPAIREVLGIRARGKGLIDILTEKRSIEDVMIYDKNHKIHVLPGGVPHKDGSELLDSPKMKEVIEELKETNDYVILDTAPVGMLTDTAVLAQAADAALFVVKQDYVNCSHILDAISQLAESKIHITGCVLNGVLPGVGGYGYRYYRYNNRYSHYYMADKNNGKDTNDE